MAGRADAASSHAGNSGRDVFGRRLCGMGADARPDPGSDCSAGSGINRGAKSDADKYARSGSQSSRAGSILAKSN